MEASLAKMGQKHVLLELETRTIGGNYLESSTANLCLFLEAYSVIPCPLPVTPTAYGVIWVMIHDHIKYKSTDPDRADYQGS